MRPMHHEPEILTDISIPRGHPDWPRRLYLLGLETYKRDASRLGKMCQCLVRVARSQAHPNAWGSTDPHALSRMYNSGITILVNPLRQLSQLL